MHSSIELMTSVSVSRLNEQLASGTMHLTGTKTSIGLSMYIGLGFGQLQLVKIKTANTADNAFNIFTFIRFYLPYFVDNFIAYFRRFPLPFV